jgi:hypothetical protein
LWRGLSQITRTTPRRRITLHFAHIFFTEALTFMSALDGRDSRLHVVEDLIDRTLAWDLFQLPA